MPFPRRLARSVAALEALGHRVVFAPSALWEEGAKPGPAALADDVNWAFAEPGVDMVLCSTGGYGSVDLLPHLDFALIRSHPKILCGFSDATSLVAGIHAGAGLVTFHGPTLVPSFGDIDGPHPVMLEHWTRVLGSAAGPHRLVPPADITFDSPRWETDDRPRRYTAATPWRGLGGGTARGPLVGGHLGTFHHLLDTGYGPPLAGSVLLLESNSEKLGPVEHVLKDLSASGVLDSITALVMGRTPIVAHEARRYEDLFRAAALRHGLPVVLDADLGHAVPILTLPIGIEAVVDADTASITVGGAVSDLTAA